MGAAIPLLIVSAYGSVAVAVRSGLLPLYEVFDSRRYRINVEPDWSDPAEYYAAQRRFPADGIDLPAVKSRARERFDRLQILARQFPYVG